MSVGAAATPQKKKKMLSRGYLNFLQKQTYQRGWNYENFLVIFLNCGFSSIPQSHVIQSGGQFRFMFIL